MEEIPDQRGREEAPDPAAASSENVGGQAEGGSGLRAASEAAAVVSAAALVGGGAGMLAGVALGAINPFALGIIGAAVGAVAPVLLAGAFGARGARAWWPRWRRAFGGERARAGADPERRSRGAGGRAPLRPHGRARHTDPAVYGERDGEARPRGVDRQARARVRTGLLDGFQAEE